MAATPGHDAAVVSGLPFYKMTGSGNDFVVLDGRSTVPEHWSGAGIRALCDRRSGVGADGLVILAPVESGLVRMSLAVRGDLQGSVASNVWLGGQGSLVFSGMWQSRSPLQDNHLPT